MTEMEAIEKNTIAYGVLDYGRPHKPKAVTARQAIHVAEQLLHQSLMTRTRQPATAATPTATATIQPTLIGELAAKIAARLKVEETQ